MRRLRRMVVTVVPYRRIFDRSGHRGDDG